MRIERWFWLPIFCVVSMLMHFGLALVARGAGTSARPLETPSIEIAFEPVVTARLPKSIQNPVPSKPKPRPSITRGPRFAAAAPFRVRAFHRIRTARTRTAVSNEIVGINPAPAAVKRDPAAVELPENMRAEAPDTTRRADASLTSPAKLHRISRDPNLTEGGGSPSPAPILGGHDGLNAPETPKEDLVYTGGGRGGANLANAAPTTGGGGGASILHVRGDNPLGEGIPEDKPGAGPGLGGGLGTGAKGGIGFASGKGIGTQPDGRRALSSLHRSTGAGIGAADSGVEVGTRPPGGGRGRGAELPGTGGRGTGYGRGRGIHVGDGADDSGPPPRLRGVPFGNVAGLLGGDNGGPPGGKGIPLTGVPGRGAVFGTRQAGGGGGPIHIVYALDISGSMREGSKILKAKDALKKALGELRRSDTFNIIVFKRDASTFQDDSVPATVANVANARIFVDSIRIGDGTNISAALELAFGMNGITHIYLMSDGEPNGGIADFAELRRFVREKNTHNIKVITLALGLGENFPGMRLLKGIAEDNNGTYDYINMAKIARPAVPGQ